MPKVSWFLEFNDSGVYCIALCIDLLFYDSFVLRYTLFGMPLLF